MDIASEHPCGAERSDSLVARTRCRTDRHTDGNNGPRIPIRATLCWNFREADNTMKFSVFVWGRYKHGKIQDPKHRDRGFIYARRCHVITRACRSLTNWTQARAMRPKLPTLRGTGPAALFYPLSLSSQAS